MKTLLRNSKLGSTVFLLFCLFFVGSVQAQKTWVGANNGDWNTGTNWSPSGVPGAGDNVIFNTTRNVNVDVNATINRLTITGNVAVTFTSSGGGRTVTIDNTGSSIDSGSSLELRGSTGSGTRSMTLAYTGSNQTMSVAGTLTLTDVGEGTIYNATNSITTVSGTLRNFDFSTGTVGVITSTAANLQFASEGTYQHDLNGGSIPTATWNVASTCLVAGITNTIPTAGFGQSFGNFTWNCTAQSGAINNIASASGGLTTINGNFTVASTNGQTLNFNNGGTARTITVGGNFTNSGGVIDWASSTTTTTMNVAGNITVSGSATLDTSTSQTAVVNGTFVLTGSAPQTITFSTPGNVTYTNFTVNNTRTLVMGSNIILSRNNNAPWRGNITVNSGGTINCGTFVVDGGGLVQTNGNFTLNSGAKMITANATGLQGSVNTTNVNSTYNSGASYEFRGAATGVFTLSTANTITGTMTINRSAGVTIDQNFTVSTLEFLDGLATTGSFAITIPSTGTITGANVSRYVNGRLNRIFNSASSFTYPIGKGGVYKPVTYQYTALTGTSTVGIEQFEAALPGTLPSSINLNNSRYWEISQTGGSSIGYRVTLDGTGDNVTGTVVMLKRESGTTTSHAVTTPNFTNTTAFTTLTGTNQFSLGSNCTVTSNAGSNQTDCIGTVFTLSANTPSFGTGAWTVTGQSTNASQFSNTASPIATFTPDGGAGTYTLTWTITNGSCTANSNITVTVNNASIAAVLSGTSSICSGGSTNLSVGITGGTSPFTVVYTDGTSNFTVNSYTSGAAIAVSPTSTTTYTLVSVTSTGGCAGTGNSGSAVVTIDTTTSTDGGVTWSNGTPTASKSVVFDGGTGTIGANFAGCSLRLTNNASVTVASGFNVTLEGRVTVDAGSTFTFNNNSNLLQNNTLANSGNIIVQRNSSLLKRLDYTLWSSPVTGQGLYAFSPFTLPNRFYVYNTSSDTYSNSVGFNLTGLQYPAPLVAPNGVNGTDSNNVPFENGKGYLIRVPYNHPTAPAVYAGSFTGVANNGTINATISTAGNGYNAVGNPYPSRLNVANFIDGNTNITGPLYFWRKTNDNTSTSYATLTKTAYVANGAAGGDTGTGFFNTGNEANWAINVGQGFLVQATSGSTISFTNSMRRSSNADQFFRNAETIESVNNGLYWLNLTDATGVFSQMAVGYSSEGTLGFDRGIDGANINNEFYLTSLIGTEEYAIQGRPDFDASDIVPLSYKAVTAGNYTISIDHTAGGFSSGTQPIYLKDNLTTTVHDLTASNYTFTSQAGTFNNRFEVVYQSALNTDNPTFTSNQVIVYKNEVNDFVINSGNVVMASVKVFDIRGRLLLERKDINASETTLTVGMANEVLLVQITSEDGVVVTKKVVR